jgi:hypothetical protein
VPITPRRHRHQHQHKHHLEHERGVVGQRVYFPRVECAALLAELAVALLELLA